MQSVFYFFALKYKKRNLFELNHDLGSHIFKNILFAKVTVLLFDCIEGFSVVTGPMITE